MKRVNKNIMNTGKIFENDFRSSINKDRCLLIRLNDQPQSFAKTAKFSLKSPCDFILYDSLTKRLIPLELKTTKYKSISFDKLNESDNSSSSKMIHRHQIIGLENFSKFDGVISGFLYNFRDEQHDTERTYFQNIKDFLKMYREINKQSFNELDILLYGAKKINGIKKRTKFHWNIDELLDSISNE